MIDAEATKTDHPLIYSEELGLSYSLLMEKLICLKKSIDDFEQSKFYLSFPNLFQNGIKAKQMINKKYKMSEPKEKLSLLVQLVLLVLLFQKN